MLTALASVILPHGFIIIFILVLHGLHIVVVGISIVVLGCHLCRRVERIGLSGRHTNSEFASHRCSVVDAVIYMVILLSFVVEFSCLRDRSTI